MPGVIYSPKVDELLEERTFSHFERRDWIDLALAALDQAGVSAKALHEAMRVTDFDNVSRFIVEGDEV